MALSSNAKSIRFLVSCCQPKYGLESAISWRRLFSAEPSRFRVHHYKEKDMAKAASTSKGPLVPRSVQWYGWVPDLPDQRDKLYAAPARVLRAMPPKVDLRSGCPPVYD